MQQTGKTTTASFLSTLPVWGATGLQSLRAICWSYFYPRSPCGERHGSSLQKRRGPDFYPRSPCGERRRMTRSLSPWPNFYPRSPCGERPFAGDDGGDGSVYFYPRSPCGERLVAITSSGKRNVHFYPRSPCGERLMRSGMTTGMTYFYPRSPCGERPLPRCGRRFAPGISIHAPRVGSDSKSAQKKCALLFFCTKLTVHTSDFVQIHRRIPDKF